MSILIISSAYQLAKTMRIFELDVQSFEIEFSTNRSEMTTLCSVYSNNYNPS